MGMEEMPVKASTQSDEVQMQRSETGRDRSREEMTSQYACGDSCRICPFPGARCVDDPDIWERVK